VLGIDLGTTNSTITEICWEPQNPNDIALRCLEVDQPTSAGVYTNTLVPSVVAIDGEKTLVGEGAKRLLARGIAQGEEFKTVFAECKNDIGAQRTYHKAPDGYRSAAEIGGHVLRFLKDAAFEYDSAQAARVTVTVPASFQAAQRLDTVRAAMIAGIPMSPGDLLDEPVAAFLDYLVSHRKTLTPLLRTPKNLVIFDFGGGTCDVAVFRPMGDPQSGQWQMNPLAVSRYHRLGGGDLDRAIVHEVLLSQFLEQNGMSAFDLDFEQRKREFEPAYLGVAEALKVGLCTEIARLDSFGKYASADKAQIVKSLPGAYPCTIAGRELLLRSPKLTAARWEELLIPFLDTDMLAAVESEYRFTCSIFAPVQDAIERAGVERSEVGLCLLVGGSSLIPQILGAMRAFLRNAQLLTYPDQESIQLAVARGAAYHALSLALFGGSIFQVVCHDRIAIQTGAGPIELVPRGAQLPWPAGGGTAQNLSLRVPANAGSKGTDLRVEIVAGDESRLLLREVVRLVGVKKGDPLCIEYRLDENQVFDFTLRLADQPAARPFEVRIENPLSNVVNPHELRLKIQQTEEDLRTGQIPAARVPDTIVELARNYAELQQIDKALDYLSRALRMKNRPDGYILNLMGIYYGERGDRSRQERFYREAAAASPGDGIALFNLALASRRQGKIGEARKIANESLQRERLGPTLTLSAQLAEAEKDLSERDKLLEEAIRVMGSVSAQGEWELHWLKNAAQMAGDSALGKKAEAELQRRKTGRVSVASESGLLPEAQK
jgi:molecular chaperone DnaK (HSP70)/Tfp pilus assembly protein PilF